MTRKNNPMPPAAVLAPEDPANREVAEELRTHIDFTRRMMLLCEDLALAPEGDRIGAIKAAAGLLRANAQIANSFARVAGIETRHRSISEVSQAPAPELNSRNFTAPGGDPRRELRRRLHRLAVANQKKYDRDLFYGFAANMPNYSPRPGIDDWGIDEDYADLEVDDDDGADT
ncbi:MAG TPA: hypothetical protein VG889_13160 [Rhizomicrobium sp.]|nr:hypothetical protein [Rhizomicrobium sp.]